MDFYGSGNNYFGGAGQGWGYGQNIPAPMNNSVMCVIVQSEEEVQRYLVGTGNTVILMCFNTKRFFIKAKDRSGIELPLRVFPFTEATAAAPAPAQQQGEPAGPDRSQPVAATKEDIDRIEKMIVAMQAALGGAQNAAVHE